MQGGYGWRSSRWMALLVAICCGLTPARADSLAFMTHVVRPLSWQDAEGRFHGIAYELSALTMQRMGYTPGAVQLYPFARALHLVQSADGKVVFPVARIPEREQTVKWVGPLVSNGVYFYLRSDDPSEIHALDDLKKLKSIGVGNRNASMALLTQQGFENLYPVNSEIQAVHMLGLGRVDAVAVGEVVFRDAERSGALGTQRFRKLDRLKLYDSDLYMAFSRNVGDEEIQRWRQQLDAVKKEWYQPLYDKYIK